MTGWAVRQFKGVAPRAEPRLLQDNQAQVATNCKLWHGSLRPLLVNLAVATTLTKPGTIQTIHRFGHDIASDTQYWFHWASDVNVCRGQIFGDAAERTYYTDGTLPKVTDNALALSGGGTDYPNVSYALGIPAPVTAITATPAGTGSGIAETRVYTYTFVSGWGEEGKPQASGSVAADVLPGQTVDLSTMDGAPTGAYNIVAKRIYRSMLGEFVFVAEIPVAQVTYNDAIDGENLGEALPSLTYNMPPAALTGLTSLPNGMMAGFVGKDLYFCEPYKPHAYPLGYVMTFDYDIVALGATDTTLIVLTKGMPYAVQGTHPSNMAQVVLNSPQSCVSKRSVAFMAGGVVYASPDGMFITNGGAEPVNLTEQIFTNSEWRSFFKPDSIHGYVYDDKYIGFYNNGTTSGGFVIDPRKGDFTMLDWYATAGYYDPQRDALFLVVAGALVKFDEGATYQTAVWRSKIFYSPHAINLGAVRVEAAAYPVSLQVFADGASIGIFSITSKFPQRLPSGFMANTWEFEVTSVVEVFSVAMAQSMTELSNG